MVSETGATPSKSLLACIAPLTQLMRPACACSKQILFPDAPLALRLSAVLAKGVVVIYEKQSKFLYEDCEEALVRRRSACLICATWPALLP